MKREDFFNSAIVILDFSGLAMWLLAIWIPSYRLEWFPTGCLTLFICNAANDVRKQYEKEATRGHEGD